MDYTMNGAPAEINHDLQEMSRTLAGAAGAMGLALGEREILLFEAYGRELLFWEQKVNLVSLKSPLDLPIRHFADSLSAAECLADRQGSLLDLGAGAGFPGLPLKIAFPSLEVTLLEATRRKVSFLKAVIRTLGLDGVTVVNGRAEQLLAEARGDFLFDTVISRATFKLPEYLRLGAGFLSPGGLLIAMKGPHVEAELRDSSKALQASGLKLSDCKKISLPVTGDKRKILIFQKT
jgi:16S rRNA (guanine527-N7)-methyltransferase